MVLKSGAKKSALRPSCGIVERLRKVRFWRCCSWVSPASAPWTIGAIEAGAGQRKHRLGGSATLRLVLRSAEGARLEGRVQYAPARPLLEYPSRRKAPP